VASTQQKTVLGGLLTGIGEGMVAQEHNRQKLLLEDQREAREYARELRDREFRSSERAASEERADQRAATSDDRADTRAKENRDESKGLLRYITPDAEGNMMGVTGGGETKGLGFKSGRKQDQAAGGMSAEDQRIYKAVLDTYTTGKGSLEGEQTDRQGAAKHLQAIGRPDLAMLVTAIGEDGGGRIDPKDPIWRQALVDAEKWADDQAGWLSKDESDFAQWGGNRTQAIQAKALEFYNQRTGRKQGGASEGGADKASATDKKFDTAEAVGEAYRSGQLTREDAERILREQFDYQ